jgi:hypothetical protein
MVSVAFAGEINPESAAAATVVAMADVFKKSLRVVSCCRMLLVSMEFLS